MMRLLSSRPAAWARPSRQPGTFWQALLRPLSGASAPASASARSSRQSVSAPPFPRVPEPALSVAASPVPLRILPDSLRTGLRRRALPSWRGAPCGRARLGFGGSEAAAGAHRSRFAGYGGCLPPGGFLLFPYGSSWEKAQRRIMASTMSQIRSAESGRTMPCSF